MLVLTIGINERARESQQEAPKKTQEPQRTKGKPHKPFKEMTGAEYMQWANRAGKGYV